MVQKTMPIYSIENYNYFGKESDFYINTFSEHIKQHDFIHTPHKHAFYYVAFLIKGTGVHTVDFIDYNVKRGSVCLLSPGQIHSFVLSEEAEGFIFFHTQSFFDSHPSAKRVKEYSFFSSISNPSNMTLDNKFIPRAEKLFTEMLKEYKHDYLSKFQKIHVLIEQLYIDLSRLYLPQEQTNKQNQSYLTKVRKLEDLIETNFKEIKSPKEYAKLMFMTDRHLNRMCKEVLNKTTSELITDRIILEAKRLLTYSFYSNSEVAEQLGYPDISYFSRLFKKKCGKTPAEFANSISNNSNYKTLAVSA